VVTLFLHGLSAGPRQFAALGAHVYASGGNVLIPRLPYHGHADRLTPALQYLRAADLVAFTADQIAIARGIGDAVRVVGFSLGGLLAAWVAQRHTVASVIAIAPLLGIAGVPGRLTPALVRFVLRRRNRFLWWDPLRRERKRPLRGYPRYGTHAVGEGLLLAARLQAEALRAAPKSPVLLVDNAAESAVNNRAIRRLARTWRAHDAPRVETHTLRGLGPSHDIIEPEGNRATIERSYPGLLALLDAPLPGGA
jgi:carboxylesterase